MEKRRRASERGRRRGPVGPTCFEEVQPAKLSLRDAGERLSRFLLSRSLTLSLAPSLPLSIFFSSLSPLSFSPFPCASLKPYLASFSPFPPALRCVRCPPLIHKYRRGRIYPLLGTLRAGTGIILGDIISIPCRLADRRHRFIARRCFNATLARPHCLCLRMQLNRAPGMSL